jgi:hypothetical protein
VKYGPTRGELWFRLAVSLAGLAFLGAAVAFRGIGGMASAEIIGLSGAFFGGSAVWTARRLWKGTGG